MSDYLITVEITTLNWWRAFLDHPWIWHCVSQHLTGKQAYCFWQSHFKKRWYRWETVCKFCFNGAHYYVDCPKYLSSKIIIFSPGLVLNRVGAGTFIKIIGKKNLKDETVKPPEKSNKNRRISKKRKIEPLDVNLD